MQNCLKVLSTHRAGDNLLQAVISVYQTTSTASARREGEGIHGKQRSFSLLPTCFGVSQCKTMLRTLVSSKLGQVSM